ncbi:MAG: type II and III secretion system protein [Verrucomicrobia bacterium]|nr:type II and III secretion system protein [Verrucomicrobiota bacterium]
MMPTRTVLGGATGLLLLAVVVFQHLQLKKLQEELRTLRQQAAQLAALQAENERLAQHQVDAAELERLRAGHLELMRLRAEVARLRAAAKAPIAQASPLTPEPASENPGEPGRLLLPPTQALVRNGMTLVTGGWLAPDGRRGIVLLTPQVNGDAGDAAAQITLSYTLLLGPDGALEKAGLGNLRSENVSAALTSYSPEAVTLLLQQLRDSGEVDVVSAPRVTTINGQQAQMRVGGAGGLATQFDVQPRIVAGSEGPGVELTLIVSQAPATPAVPGPQTLPFFPSGQPARP